MHDDDVPAAAMTALRSQDSRLRPREAELRQVATQLFRERGFHATSMQDLAEALGMNRGSLYHYIAAKDDLLWAIVSETMDRLEAHVRPELEGTGDAESRIRSAVAAHLDFAAANGDELSLLQIELRSLAPERRRALVERRDAYEAAWRRTIAEGITEGSFRPLDARLAGIVILSTCNWFTQWYRPDGSLSLEQLSAMLGDLLVAGLCAPAPAAANGPEGTAAGPTSGPRPETIS